MSESKQQIMIVYILTNVLSNTLNILFYPHLNLHRMRYNIYDSDPSKSGNKDQSFKNNEFNDSLILKSMLSEACRQFSSISPVYRKKIFRRSRPKRLINHFQPEKSKQHSKQYSTIQSPILSKPQKQFNLDSIFISQQKRPSVYSIQFSVKKQSKIKVENQVFNKNSHRETNYRFKNMGSTKRQIVDKNLAIQQNPEVMSITQKNRFTPRISKMDYVKPGFEILQTYFEKLRKSSRNFNSQKQNKSTNISQTSHLQQLQKLKNSLVDFQSKIRYNNRMPKLSFNLKDKYQKISKKRELSPLTKMQEKLVKKKSSFCMFQPWENTMQQSLINTIDVQQFTIK